MMTVHHVKSAVDAGAIVLDLRPAASFAAGHLPGAVNLRYNPTNMAARAARAFPLGLSFVLHADSPGEASTGVALLRAADLHVLGWLAGGLDAWKAAGYPTETMTVLSVDDLRRRIGEVLVLDAREEAEYRESHVPGSLDLPWTDAWWRWRTVPTGKPVAVICRTDARSGIVASILRRMGRDAWLVLGGMVDWLQRGYPVEGGPA
ncbi:MAG: hypothetical protein HY660_04075 [Armatimonadetes bacterium]|nr:hypothetical protein [Armatimonadota bacterium]